MTRPPPPPEVGLACVDFWRIIFAVGVGMMCTALIGYVLHLVAG
jgi:hypothetical protein